MSVTFGIITMCMCLLFCAPTRCGAGSVHYMCVVWGGGGGLVIFKSQPHEVTFQSLSYSITLTQFTKVVEVGFAPLQK